ncbi:hypothetical protein, partial [Enterocloster clostridioformis]|uniref:hypothetical protein n=1 Tax=Enterocloster clostridioformis TaxID=1531 RepID=UPI001F16D9AF
FLCRKRPSAFKTSRMRNWQKCWTKYIEQQIKALREELHRLHQEQLYAREVKGHGVWQEHL